MLANFLSIEYLESLNHFILKGEILESTNEERPLIFFQERIAADDYFIPKRIFLNAEWAGNQFSILVNINEFAGYFIENRIWDCFVSIGNKLEKISVKKIKGFSTVYQSINNSPFEVKGYTTKINNFAISVKTKDFTVNNFDGEIKNNILEMNFMIPSSFYNIIKEKYTIELNFKRRIHPDILYFQQVISLPISNRDVNIKMDLGTLVKDGVNTLKSTWDTFISFKGKDTNATIEYPLVINNNVNFIKAKYNITNNLEVNFYRNYRKALSFTVSMKSFRLSCTQLNPDNLLLEGIVGNLIVDKFVLRKEVIFEEGILSTNIANIPFSQLGEGFISNFSIKEVFEEIQLKNKDKFIFSMELTEPDTQVKITMPVYINNASSISKEPVIINNNYQIQLEITNSNKLSVISNLKTLKPSSNSLKLAISGSCFSRLAFSSDRFYNPNYKSKYQLVYTQFHSSIISLMSNSVAFPEERFEGFNEREVSYIKSDYRKDFFEQLERSKPDFLIMDFYVDGSKDVLMFDNDHIVTISYMLRRNLNYLYSMKDVRVISHKDINKYLSIWHKAVEEFAEKIIKYIPEERIILQKVRKTDEYISEGGKIEKFELDKHIKRSNYLFEYMENYFLNLLPNVQTINLDKRKYYSILNHPENTTPDHLEPEYYKDFMSQLDDLTIKYLLQQKKVTNK